MSAKRLARIAILASLAIVLRVVFGAFPNVKPLTAIFLVSLQYLPVTDSLLVMAVTMVGSGFLFGMSSVVVWQVFSFGFLMLLWQWGIPQITKRLPFPLWLESLLAGLVAVAYGFFISIPIAFQFGANLWAYWLNGLTFDALHAVSTILFYPLIYSIFRRMVHEKILFTAD